MRRMFIFTGVVFVAVWAAGYGLLRSFTADPVSLQYIWSAAATEEVPAGFTVLMGPRADRHVPILDAPGGSVVGALDRAVTVRWEEVTGEDHTTVRSGDVERYVAMNDLVFIDSAQQQPLIDRWRAVVQSEGEASDWRDMQFTISGARAGAADVRLKRITHEGITESFGYAVAGGNAVPLTWSGGTDYGPVFGSSASLALSGLAALILSVAALTTALTMRRYTARHPRAAANA